MGSVKDRLALAVIEDAEARGELSPGQTVIEASRVIPALRLRWCAPARDIRWSWSWPRISAWSGGG